MTWAGVAATLFDRNAPEDLIWRRDAMIWNTSALRMDSSSCTTNRPKSEEYFLPGHTRQ